MGALEGLKILDLTRMVPGPFCTMLLADFGADVIMIEQPGGPALGRRRKNFHIDRNKRSIILNLKDRRAKDIFYRLASDTDIIVEGFRPGTVEKLGIDYQRLKKINPGLIYCSISGYGQDGPYRNQVGHDINYIALSGLLSLTGKKNQPPIIPGTQIADIAGGSLMAAISILAALHHREKTGQGQYIDISMADGALSLNPIAFFEYFSSGKAPQREDHRYLGAVPCYNVYETKDGQYISIGAVEAKFWATFCRKIGREDLIDKQFDQHPDTFHTIKQIFAGKTRAEWDALLGPEEVCYSPILSIEDLTKNEHVLHRKMVVEMNDETNKPLKLIGVGPKLSLTPGVIKSPPPQPGQHTYEILEGLGVTYKDITKLEKRGALKGLEN